MLIADPKQSLRMKRTREYMYICECTYTPHLYVFYSYIIYLYILKTINSYQNFQFKFNTTALSISIFVIPFSDSEKPYSYFPQMLTFFISPSVFSWSGFPGGPVVKNPPANAGAEGDLGLIPGCGRSPGGGNGNPLQYSCLENPMGRGAWWATVHGVAESWTRLIRHTHLTNPAVQHRKALLFLLKVPHAILSRFCHSLSRPYRHLGSVWHPRTESLCRGTQLTKLRLRSLSLMLPPLTQTSRLLHLPDGKEGKQVLGVGERSEEKEVPLHSQSKRNILHRKLHTDTHTHRHRHTHTHILSLSLSIKLQKIDDRPIDLSIKTKQNKKIITHTHTHTNPV